MKQQGFIVPILVGVALAACEPSTPKPAAFASPGEGAIGASSGTVLERFFPLVHGNLWQYETTSDDGEHGLLLVRARRTSEREGELLTPQGARRIGYESEGIALLGRYVYVLKTPLALGTTFTGEHGGKTRIDAVEASITVPAGRFEGCVVTVEERLGDAPARYTTTFCPEVGIVALDVEASGGHERAELRSYGPPVNIGPEGSSFSGP